MGSMEKALSWLKEFFFGDQLAYKTVKANTWGKAVGDGLSQDHT